MGIIVEGPDNSGKSTFCAKLSSALQMPISHAKGPPGELMVAYELCKRQYYLSKNSVILDRITPFSEACYNPERYADSVLETYRQIMSDDLRSVIVYCRPPNKVINDFTNHQLVEEYDTPDHIEYVKTNIVKITHRYDELMSRVHHVRYDYTTDDEGEILNHIMLALYVPGYSIYTGLNRW